MKRCLAYFKEFSWEGGGAKSIFMPIFLLCLDKILGGGGGVFVKESQCAVLFLAFIRTFSVLMIWIHPFVYSSNEG